MMRSLQHQNQLLSNPLRQSLIWTSLVAVALWFWWHLVPALWELEHVDPELQDVLNEHHSVPSPTQLCGLGVRVRLEEQVKMS